jgi:hypothetical protein
MVVGRQRDADSRQTDDTVKVPFASPTPQEATHV